MQFVNIDAELEIHRERLEKLNDLNNTLSKLVAKDKDFAISMSEQFLNDHTLSGKQWWWVDNLLTKVINSEPIYGDFKAIQVMFRLAGESIKYPKIRLISDEGVFVQLNFKADTQDIDIYRDGWQGHGKRKYIGKIHADTIIPNNDLMTDDIKKVIHELSLDPAAVSKAMATKLGACCYCAKRLSDPISKKLGYGKICAKHFGLEWK